LKIWLKLVIVGVVLFFVGSYISALGGGLYARDGIYGVLVLMGGVVLFIVGIFIGISRVFNRAMRE